MRLTDEAWVGEHGVGRVSDDDKPGEPEIAIARAFIRVCCHQTKTRQRRRDSYSYKHLVEEWAARGKQWTYIPNGAFIVAAMREGIATFGHADPNTDVGLNAEFALSPNPELFRDRHGKRLFYGMRDPNVGPAWDGTLPPDLSLGAP